MVSAFLCAIAAGAPSTGQVPAFDLALAKRYFLEAKWISDDEGGRLWGKSLYGPMIVVDAASRQAVLNEKPEQGEFREQDGVFVGQWPENMPMGNAALPWNGRRWTMIVWSLIPPNRSDRARLLGHEMWHRIQSDIGLPPSNVRNAHLDRLEGRLWFQLEAQALAVALIEGAERGRNAIRDALTFRAVRNGKFQGSKLEEDQAEINEGLAQYTGIKSQGMRGDEERLVHGYGIRQYRNLNSYSRNFSYWTGAAYALLLDRLDDEEKTTTSWRKGTREGTSLAGLVSERLRFSPQNDEPKAIQAALRYGYSALHSQERDREKRLQDRSKSYRKLLIDGPVLIVPLSKVLASSRSDSVFSLDDLGTVYLSATFFGDWGSLQITGGGLLPTDRRSVRVPAPKAETDRSGPGWKLELNPGWAIKRGDRTGDFIVSRA